LHINGVRVLHLKSFHCAALMDLKLANGKGRKGNCWSREINKLNGFQLISEALSIHRFHFFIGVVSDT